MGGTSLEKTYNELVKIREEIKNIKMQIHSIEDRLDIYSEFAKPQAAIAAQPEKQVEEPGLERGKEQVFGAEKEPAFKLEKIGFEENIGKKMVQPHRDNLDIHRNGLIYRISL